MPSAERSDTCLPGRLGRRREHFWLDVHRVHGAAGSLCGLNGEQPIAAAELDHVAGVGAVQTAKDMRWVKEPFPHLDFRHPAFSALRHLVAPFFSHHLGETMPTATTLDPVEFDRACHDEAWGCAYSRVWRAYLEADRTDG